MKTSWIAFACCLSLTACVHSEFSERLIIDNEIEGCFSIAESKLVQQKALLLAQLQFGPPAPLKNCACSSALVDYSVIQKTDSQPNILIASASFTAMDQKQALIPLAAQTQLVFAGAPLELTLACPNDK